MRHNFISHSPSSSHLYVIRIHQIREMQMNVVTLVQFFSLSLSPAIFDKNTLLFAWVQHAVEVDKAEEEKK